MQVGERLGPGRVVLANVEDGPDLVVAFEGLLHVFLGHFGPVKATMGRLGDGQGGALAMGKADQKMGRPFCGRQRKKSTPILYTGFSKRAARGGFRLIGPGCRRTGH